MIDFKKILWEKHGVRYGERWTDYEPFPRQFATRGIRVPAHRIGRPDEAEHFLVVPLRFSYYTKKDGYGNAEEWVHIEEGGVTGYESARLPSLRERGDWHACAGTENRWDKLIIKERDVRKLVSDIDEHRRLYEARGRSH